MGFRRLPFGITVKILKTGRNSFIACTFSNDNCMINGLASLEVGMAADCIEVWKDAVGLGDAEAASCGPDVARSAGGGPQEGSPREEGAAGGCVA